MGAEKMILTRRKDECTSSNITCIDLIAEPLFEPGKEEFYRSRSIVRMLERLTMLFPEVEQEC